MSECGFVPFRECGFVPFPGNGAYGHWSCDRRRWHLGRHRFRNYTIGRVPRVWRLRNLWRARLSVWRARAHGPDGERWARTTSAGFRRRALYPTRYDPVP